MKNIYYRRKGKSLIVEGKQDGKTILIWTLPDAETLTATIANNSSFFTREKSDKIMLKMRRLDTKPEKKIKQPTKVPTIIINRTPEKDAKTDILPTITNEDIDKLWKLTKE